MLNVLRVRKNCIIDTPSRAINLIHMELQVYLPSPESSRFKFRTRWRCFRYHTQVARQLEDWSTTLDWAVKLFQV